jgi:hypothetical protein
MGSDEMVTMFVEIPWQHERTLAVPLSQLEITQGDEETKRAVEDWRYWPAGVQLEIVHGVHPMRDTRDPRTVKGLLPTCLLIPAFQMAYGRSHNQARAAGS